MIILGLTGSIGMGKSTAAEMLQSMDVPVHDSDVAARTAIGPGGTAVPAVAALFPEAYDAATQSISRPILGPIVFADAAKRKALEAIVHPHVWQSQKNFIENEQSKNRPIVVLDIPLLYETGADKRVDKVIVVTCPAFIQKYRVMRRDGMTAAKFAAIKANQMPDHEKRCRADFIVQTGLGRAVTFRALRNIIQTLTDKYIHDQKRNNISTLYP